MRIFAGFLLVTSLACAPKITRPDVIDTSCEIASAAATARWQENEVWGKYVHTKTYSVSGLALYKDGHAVSSTTGLASLAPGALDAQRAEFEDTALGHAVFAPSLVLGSLGLTVSTAGLLGALLVDDTETQLTISVAAGGLTIVSSGLLLAGVIAIPSWHRHQVSEQIVSDPSILKEVRATLPEGCDEP